MEALSSFLLWSLDNILADFAIQQGGSKGSKKVAQKTPSKSQVGLFVVLAMVLRRKPDTLITSNLNDHLCKMTWWCTPETGLTNGIYIGYLHRLDPQTVKLELRCNILEATHTFIHILWFFALLVQLFRVCGGIFVIKGDQATTWWMALQLKHTWVTICIIMCRLLDTYIVESCVSTITNLWTHKLSKIGLNEEKWQFTFILSSVVAFLISVFKIIASY